MGVGTVGRGDYMNYYKGHMDKIVGERGGFSWGGVEGWGEKAYNCNWITIKIFLKKNLKELNLKELTEYGGIFMLDVSH